MRIKLALAVVWLFANVTDAEVPDFTVREGFKVTRAADVENARFLQLDDRGTLLVSQPDRGTVTALRDEDGDGAFEKRAIFLDNNKGVHSMDFRDGWFWFSNARTGSIFKARDADHDLKADEIVEVIKPGWVEAGGGHQSWGILVGSDRIYVAVSDPQNMTDELESPRKTIYSFALDGSDKKVFATGIRNTEKLRYRPKSDGSMTTEIWGADHGSDMFGASYGDRFGEQPITDLLPPDELNHYVESGFYGHPYLVGNRIPRPEYVDRKDLHDLASNTIPPEWNYGAHWAANGFTFIDKDYFPNMRGDLVQAFHGSWNSTNRVGYCVARVMFDPMTGKPAGLLKLVDTISSNGKSILARPVDVAEAPDGTLIFSDDFGNVIYRISKVN